MMIHIANPIYDSVFKYLMEDERIARTLLSALLKKEVVEVEVRRHEYTNGQRDNISMFRIDFGAQVREADGTTKLILIELQKTWLETETLRFRQYLGAQYANPENIQKDDRHGNAIPMVTVYLLGHRVGSIEEPVLYVKHKPYDYDNVEVTKGIPDPFVESLVHDSIIVQIPLLRRKASNRLDRVLSIFDQSLKSKYNRQVLNVDEALYAGDAELQHILHRLLAAASDAKLRQDMNVEDEYFSAIESRDTAIMNRDKKIKEQNAKITQQVAKITQQDARIEQQDARIEQQDAKITQQGAKIEQQGAKIEQQDAMISQQGAELKEKENTIKEQQARLQGMLQAMLESGMPAEQIVKITGCNLSDLQALQ